MVLYILDNQNLQVTISSLGGEITSIRDAKNLEYIWQPDPAYWKKQAPHLFPVVGRLTGGSYTLDGETYQTDTHGFFRWKEMELVLQEADRLVLSMQSDADTLAQYPRQWEVRLEYRLNGNRLEISFGVENRDARPLYFGYGGHPGFRVPLQDGLAFEDYALQFEQDALPVQVGFSDDCFVQGANIALALDENSLLHLTHGLFDRDAVVLKQAGNRLRLLSPKGGPGVTVEFPGMPYVALWHTPNTDAAFVCIEPWTSLPARQDTVEALDEKNDLICLPGGRHKCIEWSITCG